MLARLHASDISRKKLKAVGNITIKHVAFQKLFFGEVGGQE